MDTDTNNNEEAVAAASTDNADATEAVAGDAVTIYSTPTCHYCSMTKEFLKENNVEYVDYNVAEDTEKRAEMIEKSGQMGVPVVMIGEEMLIGFNEAKMRELLSL